MNIKNLRLQKGWSQERLAKESGIPRSTIAALETRKMLPTKLVVLQKLAKALEVTIDELY